MKNNRQSFLGDSLDYILENTKVGVIGLGGGGSQIVQQLAHIGFKNYILCDYDVFEDTNINRTVGSKLEDIAKSSTKLSIAVRLIRGIIPDANIIEINDKFQTAPAEIVKADILFGCLDGLRNREQLENLARRNKIPYIDIGMDVTHPSNIPVIRGQVIASLPEMPCMWCMGFINKEHLTREDAAYGEAGIRPQVIWPNGTLASTAIHIAMNLLTNWTKKSDKQVLYYEYDGNKGTVRPHIHFEMNKFKICDHHNY
ncbi:ThiF family adenylyltransferase [Neobacillus rhizosphaerae]|uniref:ThiF family adenylyltransferase n=1 Tax=Neobacillus rhizosphaerae TaxID=2880965 RepID=UPI003D2C53FA